MRSIINIKNKKALSQLILVGFVLTSLVVVFAPRISYAAPNQGVDDSQCVGSNCNASNSNNNRNRNNNQNQGPGCGKGDSRVGTKINFGCNGASKNPIIDLAFALIRFLSFGVGIAVVVSVIAGGVMYTTAEGNPEKSAQAKSRVQNSIIALIFYLFIFAIVQFLVPGGLF